MTDICFSHVICRERDIHRFERLDYHLEEKLQNGCCYMVHDRAPYGHRDELEELAGEGVIFYGHNSAAESPPMVFASDGTEYAI